MMSFWKMKQKHYLRIILNGVLRLMLIFLLMIFTVKFQEYQLSPNNWIIILMIIISVIIILLQTGDRVLHLLQGQVQVMNGEVLMDLLLDTLGPISSLGLENVTLYCKN